MLTNKVVARSLLAASLLFFGVGCATKSDIEGLRAEIMKTQELAREAQKEAASAAREAREASSTARAAAGTAETAANEARAAAAQAQESSEKVEKIFQKSLRK
jgi:murein lipoprotein